MINIKRMSVLFLIILCAVLCKIASAQTTLRERFRERIKSRRQQRIQRWKENRRSAQESRSSNNNISLQHDGVIRTYRMHVPSSYDGEKSVALVAAFHGGLGSADFMANDQLYGLISKSEEQGFIVVFPNGASRFRGKFATWNAGNCCGYARDVNSDDVGFVRAVIREVDYKFNIDPEKIYALGMSNGGMFSYRLACEMADTFAAIASVTGTDNYDNCRPQLPVSIMHIHAKNDTHVLFNGGAGEGAFKDKSKVTDFVSVPETISKWVQRNGCDETPQRVKQINGAYCDLYIGCDEGAQVKLCVTDYGGHSWPGAKAKPAKKAATPTNAISATDEIWAFFDGQS